MFNKTLTKEYDCINDCIKDNPKMKAPQINRVLRGQIKSHLGYSFKFKDEDIV